MSMKIPVERTQRTNVFKMDGSLANQVLVIAFIIGICAVNVFLIFIITKNKTVLYSHKRLTLISLACGDVVLSVFSLVIAALELFGEQTYDCSSGKASVVYQRLLLPFVYAVGLIVLVVQKMFKEKGGSLVRHTSDIIKALAVSTFPWILGLLVILPLTEGDSETCSTDNQNFRSRGLILACVIVPSTAAALMCGITLCIGGAQKQDANEDTKAQKAKMPNTPLNFLNSPEFNEVPAEISTVDMSLERNYSDNQYDVCEAEYKPLKSGTELFAPKFNDLLFKHNMDQPQNIVKNSSRGKYVLMIMSFINFICVVPMAGLLLVRNVPAVPINMVSMWDLLAFCFYWLSILRSFITPLIWICRHKT